MILSQFLFIRQRIKANACA